MNVYNKIDLINDTLTVSHNPRKKKKLNRVKRRKGNNVNQNIHKSIKN